MTQYKSLNFDDNVPDLSRAFQIRCPPDTDIWEKPPSHHAFNAPIIYTTTSVSSFKSARVTVSAEWKEKYDQGGLVLVVKSPDGTRHWVKCGIELMNDEAQVSVVTNDRWSDWSLRPTLEKHSTSATIELGSRTDGVLWVYLIDSDGKKHPAREVAWWGALEKNAECWVGVYAAKPAQDDKELIVNFSDFSAILA